MTDYICILSIGPVQSFIASARKSRDLWSGSCLLSEISKAGAFELHQLGATLIFPHIDDIALLEKDSDFSVGNKLQAKITCADVNELTSLIDSVKAAINERFLEEVNASKQAIDSQALRQDLWDTQKNDYVEVQWAWAKLTDEAGGYQKAIALAGSALASRKATRDFTASATDPYEKTFMLPKSSLDGVRETVLTEPKKLKPRTYAKLGLTRSEQLDCVGVVKRLGFAQKAEQFTAFSRVAAHAWLAKVIKAGHDLAPIKDHYDVLVKLAVATRVKGNKDNTGSSIYQQFAFDGQYLYESRIAAGISEWRGVDDAVVDALKAMQKTLRPLWKEFGQPQTYGVMLLADGDKMGELLDKATSITEHQKITSALSTFAASVRQTMQTYSGHCIYAGGDDVLGLVPLDTAYACANALRKSFSEALHAISDELSANTPTLSVGLAICHHMTPFAVIRDMAKQAEKHAKGDHCAKEDRRNALGVLLSVRSGSDTLLRMRWDDSDTHHQFADFIAHYIENNLPSRVAYSVRDIDIKTQAIALDDNKLHKNIQTAEMTRMLKQARTKTGNKINTDTIELLKERGKAVGLAALADELIVARWFAAKTKQDLGRI